MTEAVMRRSAASGPAGGGDERRRAITTLRVLLGLAIPLSVFHYTDNYLSYDEYPRGEILGILITEDIVWSSWIIFTIGGVIGYWLYLRGRIVQASALLAFYSISGLISIGHYTNAGMSRLEWWQHTGVWIDIVFGTLILAFAMWSATGDRRRALA